jgi:predicted RNA-binding Zn-ribbon protein involved in translation (DUF1610 family)
MTTTAIQPLKGGFRIGVTCPACGGELELEKDFYVLTCSHCGSVLRVKLPDVPAAYMVKKRKQGTEIRFLVDRYCKENGLPLTGGHFQCRSILYPYWKIDAVTLKVRHTVYEVDTGAEEEISSEATTEEREFTSISLTPFEGSCAAGPEIQEVPETIGIRAEYLRLMPFSEQNIQGTESFSPIKKSLEQAVAQLTQGLGRLSAIDSGAREANRTDLLHHKGSIVYFPYFVADAMLGSRLARFAVDGVTGRVMGHSWMEEVADSVPEYEPLKIEFGALDVTLHRCSNCGVDLRASRAFVYQCHNCDRIFFMENDPSLSTEIRIATSAQSAKDTLVPFWSIQIPEEFAPQFKRLFGGIYGSNVLVIPAFQMRNLEAMFRLCKRMSPMAPKLATSVCEKLGANQMPVTVGLDEAMTLTEAIWKRELAGRNQRDRLSGPTFRPTQISLLFAPFHSEQYFFVDSFSGAVTFERGSLA